jgi:hypothetical protein
VEVYTTAELAGLLMIPLVHHSPLAEMGHSRPVAVVLEVLEVYTMVLAQDCQQFVEMRKELGKWMYHI